MNERARPPIIASDLLAAFSRTSTRHGNAAVARAQLIECLSLLHSSGTEESGAAALDAVGELAEALGQLEQAVEFYGASQRVLRSARLRSGPAPKRQEQRAHSLEKLRLSLGDERYGDAWKKSRGTPFPFEVYVSAALVWLDGLSVGERSPAGTDAGPDLSPGTTAQILAKARTGDSKAKEWLIIRHLEPLRRFAHGRLPRSARGQVDTDDLVQTTLVRGLERLDSIHPKRKGGFLAYLRKVLLNLTRDEIRRARRREDVTSVDMAAPQAASSVLEDLSRQEILDAYRIALEALQPRQREAIAMRVEHGRSYEEIAAAIGCPTANAARMLVSRALTVVSKAMRTHRPGQ